MDLSIQQYLETSGSVDDVDDVNDVAVGRCRQDNAILLRDCLVTNYTHLYRRLSRHLGCPDQAGDCLHDAWLRLEQMTMPATVRHPEAYVYRVACNLAVDRLRSHRPAQYASDADAEISVFADPAPGPDIVAELRSEVNAVERALQHLPRRHQAVLMALRIEELTRQEVAASQGLSLRRVDTMLRQALDYCAEHTNQQVLAGRRGSRRVLSAMIGS